jgi:hypothetical protein
MSSYFNFRFRIPLSRDCRGLVYLGTFNYVVPTVETILIITDENGI